MLSLSLSSEMQRQTVALNTVNKSDVLGMSYDNSSKIASFKYFTEVEAKSRGVE